MVNIPSDLRKNKETIIGNMDLRECICLFLGLLFALSILYYIRVVLGYKRIVIAAFIGGIFVIPFLILGFKKINGMKMDDYFKVFVSNKILARDKRINASVNYEIKLSNKKYEIIRHYKLVKNEELIDLRKHLIDKKILMLTEYIDYKNKHIAILRLDGKDMILEQIKRNKKAIDDKNIEIKNFIKEIKIVKKEKFKNLDKDEINDFNNKKKAKLKELKHRLKTLKFEKKYLQEKTLNDFKDEVDIFEDLFDIKAERIFINNKKKNDKVHNEINNLREEISNDERKVYELHLFNKSDFKEFINSIDDEMIFINNDDLVDVYIFDKSKNIELVDLIEIDKNESLYKNKLLSLEARNFYNHYRKINNLEEIL